MSKIATQLCQKDITLDDTFKIMMALKLSRMAQVTPTFDTFTDLIGYAEGWWNALQEAPIKSAILFTFEVSDHNKDAVQSVKLVTKASEIKAAEMANIKDFITGAKEFIDVEREAENAKLRVELQRKEDVIKSLSKSLNTETRSNEVLRTEVDRLGKAYRELQHLYESRISVEGRSRDEELKHKNELITKLEKHVKYLQGSAVERHAEFMDQQTESVIRQLEANGWKISR